MKRFYCILAFLFGLLSDWAEECNHYWFCKYRDRLCPHCKDGIRYDDTFGALVVCKFCNGGEL